MNVSGRDHIQSALGFVCAVLSDEPILWVSA